MTHRSRRQSSRRSVAVLAVLVAAAAAPAGAAERIVVMEFTGANVAPEVLRAVTDHTRLSALEPARKVGHDVMTRESTTLVVQQMGGACIEGQCEIEIARTVGAALVVTGEVRRLDQTYLADVKLHDTAKGTLLAGERYSGTSDLDVIEKTGAATERLLVVGLERYLGGPVAALRPKARAAAGPPRRYLELRGGTFAHAAGPSRMAPDGQGKGTFAPEVRLGYQLSPSWALDVGSGWADLVMKYDLALGRTTIDAFWVTAATAWRPAPRTRFKFFSVAAIVGAVFYGAEYRNADDSAGQKERGAGPAGGLELRFDWAIGAFSLGLRATGLYAKLPTPETRTAFNGEVFVSEFDPLQLLAATAAVQYRF